MGNYTGTERDDEIRPGYLSSGVTAAPPSTTPGEDGDVLLGLGGDDWLDGGLGSDILDGGSDQDTLWGGADDDALNGGDGRDLLSGDDGSDVLLGCAGDDSLWGGNGDDILEGSSGNDALDGGSGTDTLRGGEGNDYYNVTLGDMVFEETDDSSGGRDTVYSFESYALGYGLEALKLEGAADVDGTGNGLDNSIFGTIGTNVLSGKAGKDKLSGFEGNDSLDGGTRIDTMDGGAGRDDLDGGNGKDTLSGGDGNDEFLFAKPKECGDTITDFHDVKEDHDRIVIDDSAFKGGLDADGHLSRSQFQISDDKHAEDAGIRFIFRTTDETLWFDKNGDKSDGLTMVADLQDGAEVTHTDIWLV